MAPVAKPDADVKTESGEPTDAGVNGSKSDFLPCFAPSEFPSPSSSVSKSLLSAVREKNGNRTL